MPDAPAIDDDPQEIRLALVMTGGVSLAVWMGGVVAELDRLARAAGPYGPILDLADSTVSIDVIGGTSAGGINGGLLALCIARGTDTAGLRPVWLEMGALLALLRSPDEEHPPSLLRGDAYFSTNLRTVFGDLAASGPPTDPGEHPMHLTMTTTLMNGRQRVFQDDYGGRISDLSHRATFTFVRGEDWDRDDFADPLIAERLALASRSTASFPGAFEPSFVPIGPRGVAADRPDMAAYADFDTGGFVMDGGVLDNKPIHAVLEVLFAQQTEGHGRRVLAYIVPDPHLPAAGHGDDVPAEDDPAHPPGMTKTLGSSMHIPKVESVSADLESIRTHNQQVAAQRRLRESLLGEPAGASRASGAHAPVDVTDLAAQIFPAYLGSRRDTALRSTLDLLRRGLGLPKDENVEAPGDALDGWDRLAVMAALRDAFEPMLPTAFPADDEPMLAWPWDVAGVKSAVGTVTQLVRMGLDLAGELGITGDLRAALHDATERLAAARSSLQRIRRDEDTYWLRQRVPSLRAALAGEPAGRDERLAAWARASVEGPPLQDARRDLAALAMRVAGIAVSTAGPLHDVARAASGRPEDAEDPTGSLESAASLVAMVGAFAPPQGPDADPDRAARSVLRRALAMAVVQPAFGGGEPVVEQIIELMQISAQAPNGFDARATGAEKLAGLQLSHFGAFYKRSWRANDWMWGRMDAVPGLVRIVLDPARLRRRMVNEPSFGAAFEGLVRRIALPPDDPDSVAVLQARWDEAGFTAELAAVRNPSVPLPVALTSCVMALTRRIQLDILKEELPHVASAVRQDLLDGAAPRPEAVAFLNAVHAAQSGTAAPADTATTPAGRRRSRTIPEIDADASLRPGDAVASFGLCAIGTERMGDESDSPLYQRTMNTATAVGLRAAQRHVEQTSDALGHRPPARQTMPVLYPLMRDVLGNSAVARAAMIVCVLLGAGLEALALRGAEPAWGVVVAGAVFLLVGMALVFLRTRWPAAVVIVAVAAAVLLGLSYAASSEGWFGSGAFRAVIIGLLAGVLIGLGSRSRHATPPRPPA